MTTRRQWRRFKRLSEQGRRLASQREDLIAAGVDPAELPVPLHPIKPLGPEPRSRSVDAALARVWLIVALACFGAFVGCVVATGAMLVVNQAPTWHSGVSALAGACWVVGAVLAVGNSRRVRRQGVAGA
jgi:hypothetical protein